MSERSIYDALIAGCLSPAGACGMMGNMYCESLLKSNIVETRCSMSGSDYTYNVDNGIITRWQFMSDSYGYGLCQWTYSTRKDNLYVFAKANGVSIADEKMQCDFCLSELQSEYKELYKYLCETNDIAEATKRICAEYERPAINNFADRINAAHRFYNQFATDTDVDCNDDACQIEAEDDETCDVTARVLRKGCLGRDVFVMQCALFDMGYDCGIPDGDFGTNTHGAVCELQRANSIEATGIVSESEWEIILASR